MNSYVKTEWINRKTPLNASNLNRIESAIYDLAQEVIDHNNDIASLKNSITGIVFDQKYNVLKFTIDGVEQQISIPLSDYVSSTYFEDRLRTELTTGYQLQGGYRNDNDMSLQKKYGSDETYTEIANLQFKTVNGNSVFGTGNIKTASAEVYMNDSAPGDTDEVKVWIDPVEVAQDEAQIDAAQIEENNGSDTAQYDNI